jgi:hypothetical protein
MLTVLTSRIMSRTTVNLDPSVLRGLKQRARNEGKSLGQVISEILGPALAQGSDTGAPSAFHWHTAQMGPPRVDLEDEEAVRQALDGA